MKYLELPAPPPLDAIVHCFWFLRGAEAAGEPQVIVTDGRLEIILHRGDPFERRDGDGTWHAQAATLVSGQLSAPLVLRATGWTDLVGIRFRTAAASAVLRFPLAQLADRVEPLGDPMPRLAGALRAAGDGATDPAELVARLSAVLLAHAVQPTDALAAAAVQALGQPRIPGVEQLAEDLGVSARSLERRVLAATGAPPTRLRRMLRFRRAFRLIDQAPAGAGARIAAQAGYYDQAHMLRDFHQFAGAPPSTFFREDPELARVMLGGPHEG
jgi:AraC-like DNA-binding protein